MLFEFWDMTSARKLTTSEFQAPITFRDLIVGDGWMGLIARKTLGN